MKCLDRGLFVGGQLRRAHSHCSRESIDLAAALVAFCFIFGYAVRSLFVII